MRFGWLWDGFDEGAEPYWERYVTGRAEMSLGNGAVRLTVAGASRDSLSDAEFGDYRRITRARLPWRPPLRMSVRARFSDQPAQLRGTAGFGFWNAPGDASRPLVAAPNALWFFHNGPESDMRWTPEARGWGWRAEMLNFGTYPAPLVTLGALLVSLPGIGRLAASAATSRARTAVLPIDASLECTRWHDYTILWFGESAMFGIDDRLLGIVRHPPGVGLGFVAWMDNQRATISPGGNAWFDLMDVPQRQWLEIDHVSIWHARGAI
jgi:hypothetical protein